MVVVVGVFCMQSMLINSRRVWGHAPRKILKLGVRRLNLEAFSVVLVVNQILVLFNTCLTVVLG